MEIVIKKIHKGNSHYEKNEVVMFENEVVIFEIVFGMVLGQPWEEF
jgi:hypothetical protein